MDEGPLPDTAWEAERRRSGPGWPDDGDQFGRRGPAADRPHKRRADVTAVDLGYSGRRTRPGHAAGEDRPADDDVGEDQYWRQPVERERW